MHALGLVPLLWLVGLAFQRDQHDAAWWWLAAAFGVSFVADTLALFINPIVSGYIYPLLQGSIIGAVLLSRSDAATFGLVLGVTALAALAVLGIGGYVPLHVVASLGVTGIAYHYRRLPSLLRWSLLVSFGVGCAAWLLYAEHITWTTWGLYQLTRVAGTALFCAAALHPSPTLRLVRHAA